MDIFWNYKLHTWKAMFTYLFFLFFVLCYSEHPFTWSKSDKN